VIPGLGQLSQGRWLAALMQFGTVAAYATVALATGGRRAALVALLWNAGSAVDAWWFERNRGPDPAD
jgi:hypothetical protein